MCEEVGEGECEMSAGGKGRGGEVVEEGPRRPRSSRKRRPFFTFFL